ncbi:hypothetical protein P170DRAFT_474358 [Aspergillus steynii IBT 23096]|uniref:Uncharacterized protein n=1 Tax=Aspergillus steynii IBT 23096 TaxID=1392250 RepID=A0A2I2GD60_9EURO|nr:uncharacterized protein P170DRAFT_474358 [Aspergillus steynii IBT 23096]PLB50802.1 hypothetical protein P170DRAFT_474358 [Aspergillus steynii IBT 23096]
MAPEFDITSSQSERYCIYYLLASILAAVDEGRTARPSKSSFISSLISIHQLRRNAPANMKSFSVLSLLVLTSSALALPTPDQSGVAVVDEAVKTGDYKRSDDLKARCGLALSPDQAGTEDAAKIAARCAIPWTQNYGEYDDVEKRDDSEN